jgi:ribosome maturation factor RimP
MQTALKTTTPGIDRAALDAVIEPIARAHGAEVVDVEYKIEAGSWILRVFVEKLGSSDRAASTRDAAIDLQLCSGFARDLSPALDVADLIPHRYNLEVSSPGVERPLKAFRDYARFSGQKAKLKLRNASSGQKVLRGILGTRPPSTVTVLMDAKSYDVALDDIESAHLVFEFGPSPKPGGKKRK